MGNMGYCRFHNTVENLEDCQEHMDDPDLSEEEQKARKRLIRICCDIAMDFDNE